MIDIHDLSMHFGNKRVIDRLHLKVHEGCRLSIQGKNGSGKSTLIKLMIGLLVPTKGSILTAGLNPSTHRHQLMKISGVLLEGNRSLYWHLTALDNLIYHAGLKGLSKSQSKKKIDDLLNLFTLSAYKNEYVENLSRGTLQKISIACSLVNSPKILFLDEPTLGLDDEFKLFFIQFLKSLDCTIIFSSHDQPFVKSVSNLQLNIQDSKNVF